MRRLTDKQRAVLDYIIRHTSEYGCFPTYGNIADEFGFVSQNSVTQNLKALVKKGHLRRDEFGYKLARPMRCPMCGHGRTAKHC